MELYCKPSQRPHRAFDFVTRVGLYYEDTRVTPVTRVTAYRHTKLHHNSFFFVKMDDKENSLDLLTFQL